MNNLDLINLLIYIYQLIISSLTINYFIHFGVGWSGVGWVSYFVQNNEIEFHRCSENFVTVGSSFRVSYPTFLDPSKTNCFSETPGGVYCMSYFAVAILFSNISIMGSLGLTFKIQKYMFGEAFATVCYVFVIICYGFALYKQKR